MECDRFRSLRACIMTHSGRPEYHDCARVQDIQAPSPFPDFTLNARAFVISRTLMAQIRRFALFLKI